MRRQRLASTLTLSPPGREEVVHWWHFTHRGSPSLFLATSHQRVSPQWHPTRCARTAPGPNTGTRDHRQSVGCPRRHFTRCGLPSLRLSPSNAPDSPQWDSTHLAGTASCLNPRGCWSCLESCRASSCCGKSHCGVNKDFELCMVGSCSRSACSRIPPSTSTNLVCPPKQLSSAHPFFAHPPCTRTRRRFHSVQ